jgi:Cutinase
MNGQPPIERASALRRRDAPPRPRRRFLPVVAVLLGLLASSAFAGITAPASAAPLRPLTLPPPPPTCPGVTFLGARGSGESFNGYAGLGPPVDRMAGVLSSRLAVHRITLSRVGDPYPADSVSDLEPSFSELALLVVDPPLAVAEYLRDNLGRYLRSIDAGIGDAVSLAEQTVSSCPETKLVLAGYSQGAMVMHQAELRLAAAGRRAVLRQIAGTLLLGDGDRVPSTRAREFGSSAARAEGIRTYLHGVTPHDVELPARTANICNAGDLVCDFNLDRLASFSHAAKVHTSYAVKTKHGVRYSPLLTQAASWLASRIIR